MSNRVPNCHPEREYEARGMCRECYLADYYKKHKQRYRDYANANKESRNQRGRELSRRKRLEVIEAMGSVCARCGFDDPRALQIDHVNGGGNQEIIALGGSGQRFKLWEKAVSDTEGNYQLLCANCNWIKRWENNENGKYMQNRLNKNSDIPISQENMERVN